MTKTICIDARYVFPKIDGIGRYLYNLIDKLITIVDDRDDIHFKILEIEKFREKSILRNFDGHKNFEFISLGVFPQSLPNHYLHRYLRNIPFDLFHYPQFDLPWRIQRPTITTIHDMNPQRFPLFFGGGLGYVKKYYSILANDIALRRSCRIISMSENTKNEMVDLYGEKYRDKILTIYTGLDALFLEEPQNFEYEKIINGLQKKYGFQEYVLYVGNNRPHKNIRRLIESFSEVNERFNGRFKLLVVGSQLQNRYDNYMEIVRRHNLEGVVVCFEASDKELLALYRGASAVANVSLSEGFGLPVIEAMSQGVPVVTSNGSSLKEVAQDAAELVNPVDVKSIAQGIIHVLEDTSYAEKLKRVGFARIKDFTWEKCARQTFSLYCEVLKIPASI